MTVDRIVSSVVRMASKPNTASKPRAKKGEPKRRLVGAEIPVKLAQEVLEWLSEGQTLASWCRGEGRPAARTVGDWKARDAGFAAAYAHAREIGGDLIADRMRETARSRTRYRDDVNHRKLIIDVDKWLLARWFPTRYGDRVALAGDPDTPLTPPQTDQEAARAIALLMARAATRRMKAKK